MFKPARMTRILVAGHQDRMEEVIAVLHAEGAMHLEDYLDPTGTTDIGTPLEAGDRVSALLVRVRGLQKALGVEDMPRKALASDDPAALVAEAEQAVLPVVDRLGDVRARISALEAEADHIAPLRGIDIHLDVIGAVRAVRAYVGTVRADPAPALRAAGIEHDATLAPGGRALVLLVRAADQGEAEKVLQAHGFSPSQFPANADGTPDEVHAEIESRLAGLRRESAEAEVQAGTLRERWGGRLAALESLLAAEVERTQAPLQFGVTKRTFHVEGWVPRSRFNHLHNVLTHRFGDALYVADLGDAPRGHTEADRDAKALVPGDGGAGHGGAAGQDAGPSARKAAGHKAAGAGGAGPGDAHGDDHHEVPVEDEAPTLLANRGGARHFEFMLRLLATPRYRELDPTRLLWLFFPLFLGLMVGDVVIGLFIVLFAWYIKDHRIFGIGGKGVSRPLMVGGILAIIFGALLFGEGLGMHFVLSDEALEHGEHSWESAFGIRFPTEGFLYKSDPSHYGLQGSATGSIQPLATEATGIRGLLAPHDAAHLSVNGWFNLGVYSKVHDVEALLIWSVLIGILHLTLGFILGVRNVAVAHGVKLAVQEKLSWLLIMASVPFVVWGLSTGPAWALWGGGALFLASVVLLWMGVAATIGFGFIALLELPGLLGNILSYTRLAAIGASKAGMAIAFATIGFDLIGGVAGIVVYLLASLLITALAILSGSLQALRLQLVEFFSKFYEGGGRPYVPFGRRAAQPPSSP